ncbi:MAG: cysteine hydrolase family protein [Bacteroidota bacterium]
MIDEKQALLLIDVQKGLDDWDFYGGKRNNPNAEKNMAKILSRWRLDHRPIFHVRHSSSNPNSPLHCSKPGFQIKDTATPFENEPLFTKNVNSAFIGTNLEHTLRKDGINTLVIVGLTTNHCVSTSVRMAANLGFEVILLSDATACFNGIGIDGTSYSAELMHQITLASLKDEFAQIMTTATLLTLLS